MKQAEAKIQALQSAASILAEKEAAEDLIGYIHETRLDFGMTLKDAEMLQYLSFRDFEKNNQQKIQVELRLGSSAQSQTYQWEPMDNENLYILMRE